MHAVITIDGNAYFWGNGATFFYFFNIFYKKSGFMN